MFKFGDKVIIRDGTSLDGATGVIYRIEAEQIDVLLEREVIWPVKPAFLELATEVARRPDAME